MRRTKAQILKEKIVDAACQKAVNNKGAVRIQRLSDINKAASVAYDELAGTLGPVEIETVIIGRLAPLVDSFVKEAV